MTRDDFQSYIDTYYEYIIVTTSDLKERKFVTEKFINEFGVDVGILKDFCDKIVKDCTNRDDDEYLNVASLKKEINFFNCLRYPRYTEMQISYDEFAAMFPDETCCIDISEFM